MNNDSEVWDLSDFRNDFGRSLFKAAFILVETAVLYNIFDI